MIALNETLNSRSIQRWQDHAICQLEVRHSADEESKLVNAEWEEREGTNWNSSCDIYTPPWVKCTARGDRLYCPGARLGDDLEARGGGVKEAQETGDVCIHRAGSHCTTAETHTALQSNYPPTEKIFKGPSFLDGSSNLFILLAEVLSLCFIHCHHHVTIRAYWTLNRHDSIRLCSPGLVV